MSGYVDTVIILFVYHIMHTYFKTFWTHCVCKSDRLSLWLSTVFILFVLTKIIGKLSENKEKKNTILILYGNYIIGMSEIRENNIFMIPYIKLYVTYFSSD